MTSLELGAAVLALVAPAIGVIYQLGRIVARVEHLETSQQEMLVELRTLRGLWDRRHER